MKPQGLPPLTILGQDPVPPPGPAARPGTNRYGSFLYVALAGLVVLVLWVGYFAYRVWGLRDVWGRIAVLHDVHRTDLDRIQAARELARDPRVNQRQLWDMAVRPGLPGPARYLLAEGLGPEATADAPRDYGLAVAYSEGWPDWFRLQLLRPMAEAAHDQRGFPEEALRTLARHDDPVIATLALYVAAEAAGDDKAAVALERASHEGGPAASLARLLLGARTSDDEARRAILGGLRDWIRAEHPASRELWRGLREADGAVVADPAPDLHSPD